MVKKSKVFMILSYVFTALCVAVVIYLAADYIKQLKMVATMQGIGMGELNKQYFFQALLLPILQMAVAPFAPLAAIFGVAGSILAKLDLIAYVSVKSEDDLGENVSACCEDSCCCAMNSQTGDDDCEKEESEEDADFEKPCECGSQTLPLKQGTKSVEDAYPPVQVEKTEEECDSENDDDTEVHVRK